MKSLNEIKLIGHIGKEPEIKVLSENSKVARFSMATTEKYINKSGDHVEHTCWHNIVLWNGLADITEKYIKKGHLIYIAGKIDYRSYEDQEGTKKYVTEVIANNIILLGSKPPETKPTPTITTQEPPPDDIDPFTN